MSRITERVETILDTSVRHRKEFYNTVCAAEKEEPDFKGSQRIREFIILYFKGVVPFRMFFDRVTGEAKGKHDLCDSLKNLNKSMFSGAMNATTNAIGVSVFGLGTAAGIDRALNGRRSWKELATTDHVGSGGFLGVVKNVPMSVIVVGTILAVAGTVYFGTKSLVNSLTSSAHKKADNARRDLRRIDRHVPKRDPGKVFANVPVTQLRLLVSEKPNYSVLMLVRPDGTLRNSFSEIAKAYDLYNSIGDLGPMLQSATDGR